MTLQIPSVRKVAGSFLAVILFCFLFSDILLAQSAGRVSGQVKEADHVLEYAIVTLQRLPDTTKAVGFSTTDSAGNFSFTRLMTGDYRLRISLVGYGTLTLSFLLGSSNADLKLGSLVLNRDNNALQNVTVSTQKKLIEKTANGFVVNAAANITQAGGTATDLLRNTPSVSVDAEGALTMRGKTPLILVNGRNSSLANPDNIPASSIESIEIIQNADARYDANAESGIINIKLKKNKQNGTNGSVALGTGMGSRGRVSSSVLLNNKVGKINIGLAYDNRFAGRTRNIEANRTNFFLPDTYLLNQYRDDSRLEQLQNLKLSLDYTISSRDRLSLEAIGNTEGQDNHETLNTRLFKQNGNFVSNTSRYSNEIERSKVGEYSLDYSHKYLNEKRSLTASLTNSLNRDRQNTGISSQDLTKDYIANGAPYLQRTHNYEDGHVTEARLDYAFPFAGGQMETGYKGLFRGTNDDYESADQKNGVYIVNTAASNLFRFHEQVHAAYMQYHGSFQGNGKTNWQYHLGLRAEQVLNDGNTQNGSAQFENRYLKFFPSVQFIYQLPDESSWKLAYNKRINRPGLGQLNPFIDITDSLSPHGGNPNLQPEIIHAFEFGYGKEWGKTALTTNLFYRYSLNSIRQYSQLLSNGAIFSYPVNIGNASIYGWETMLSARPLVYYDFNASFTVFDQRYNGSNVATDAVQEGWAWNGKLINNFAVNKMAKLQVTGSYTAPQITPQGKRIAQYFVDMGFQQKLGKGNTRLGITITDLLNTLQSGNNNFTAGFSQTRYAKADTRAIMVTFACSFRSAFKEKLMENKFSAEY
ncbi:MAG: TonB-dependent receptor [Bacteroidota bacterium]